MNIIKFAVIRFSDEKLKNVIVNVSDVFLNKKDELHIQPKNHEDYEERYQYYVYYRECGNECKPSDKCCIFYKGFIISLGGKLF